MYPLVHKCTSWFTWVPLGSHGYPLVHMGTPESTNVPLGSQMHPLVHKCTSWFTNAPLGSQMLLLVHKCSPWFTNTPLGSQMYLWVHIHMYADGPLPEQIFSIVKSGETKISLKSGYGELFVVVHSGIAQHMHGIHTIYMYSILTPGVC